MGHALNSQLPLLQPGVRPAWRGAFAGERCYIVAGEKGAGLHHLSCVSGGGESALVFTGPLFNSPQMLRRPQLQSSRHNGLMK